MGTPAKIEIKSAGRLVNITVDGVKADQATYAVLRMEPNELPVLELEFTTPHIEYYGEAVVNFSDETIKILKGLGWTPPKK